MIEHNVDPHLYASMWKWRAVCTEPDMHFRSVEEEGNRYTFSSKYQTCALCNKYWENDCRGCPVAERTKKIYCEGSPYEDCIEYIWDSIWGKEFLPEDCYSEYDFLCELQYDE